MHVVLMVWLMVAPVNNQAQTAKLLSTSQVYNWQTCKSVSLASERNKTNKNLSYTCSYTRGSLK